MNDTYCTTCGVKLGTAACTNPSCWSKALARQQASQADPKDTYPREDMLSDELAREKQQHAETAAERFEAQVRAKEAEAERDQLRARVQELEAALQAERDQALRECRGIIGRHKRYWEDADAEIADLQKRICALKGKP